MQVAEAAVFRWVATLLIEAAWQVPGRTDAATGRIELDGLGELVLKMGGRVVVVPAERTPPPMELAAMSRF